MGEIQKPPPTIAYILCAGQGLRLGGVCKGRLSVNDRPLLTRQIDLMHDSGIAHTVVITGYQSDAIRSIVDGHQAQLQQQGRKMSVECIDAWADKPEHDNREDIQGSVLTALRHAQSLLGREARMSGLLISLVDLPILSVQEIADLLEFAKDSRYTAVIPFSEKNQPGHPLWLARDFVWTLPLQGHFFSLRDALRSLQRSHPETVCQMSASSLGYFTDIDTPEQIDFLRREFGLEIVTPESSSRGADRPEPSSRGAGRPRGDPADP